jgi:hypothetical protein
MSGQDEIDRNLLNLISDLTSETIALKAICATLIVEIARRDDDPSEAARRICEQLKRTVAPGEVAAGRRSPAATVEEICQSVGNF